MYLFMFSNHIKDESCLANRKGDRARPMTRIYFNAGDHRSRLKWQHPNSNREAKGEATSVA